MGWLLAAWEAKALSALGSGGWERFSPLPHGERERLLLGWSESRLAGRRAAFEALRKGVLLLYYMRPGRAGGRNPAWAAVGYDGPLGTHPEARPKPLVPRAVEGDTTLECDVVVVGSGAGGGAAAGVLSEASTWWWWRRAATSTTRTSTAPRGRR
ncbi:MAG: hypothetical protein ACM3UV_01545 [Nocardioidaceae bacterium]